MTKRVLWVNPVGCATYDRPIADMLASVKDAGTIVEVVSLDLGAVSHVEYRAYEVMAYPEVVKLAYQAGRDGYDAMVIGCFFDTALREAREVSGDMIVTAPCIAGLQTVEALAERFSVIVTRNKCIGHMTENIRAYGASHRLASMRPLNISTAKLQSDPGLTAVRIEEEARKAIEQDGAEAILLGCTLEFGFHEKLQQSLGVPIVDALCNPFKVAEHLAGLKQRFGWVPSRIGSQEPAPADELAAFGIMTAPAIANRMVA